MWRTGAKHGREDANEPWVTSDLTSTAGLAPSVLASGIAATATRRDHAVQEGFGTSPVTFGKFRKLEPLSARLIDEEVQLYLQTAHQECRQGRETALASPLGSSRTLHGHRGDLYAPPPHPLSASGAALGRPQHASPPPTSALSSSSSLAFALPLPASHTANCSATDESSAVDLAVHEAFRVLRTCWTFAGRPQDAFEPARHLPPIALHLLLTYGCHRLTSDGQYVVLDGAEEQLPFVGVLLDCLYRHMQQGEDRTDGRPRAAGDLPFCTSSMHESSGLTGLSPFRASYHSPHSTASAQAMDESEDNYVLNKNARFRAGGQSIFNVLASQPMPAPATSRLVLANCHSFGWMDSLANADYEASGRALQQVNATLRELVLDETYTYAGRPSVVSGPTPSCTGVGATATTGSASDLSAQTIVLLADAVLMDGGVPSLHLARHGAAVFTAHHQYGRGLACLVPVLPAVHTAAAEASSLAARADRGQTPPPPLSPSPSLPLPSRVSMPALSTNWWDRLELPPLSCGTRAVSGAAAAQAVLLSPVGPLVLHLQFQLDAGTSEFARLFADSVPSPSSPLVFRDMGDSAVVQDVRETPFDGRAHQGLQDGASYASSASSVVVQTSSPATAAGRPTFTARTDEEDETRRPSSASTGGPSPTTCAAPGASSSLSFSIADLPYVLYLAVSGEALTGLDVANAAAVPTPGESVSFTSPSSTSSVPAAQAGFSRETRGGRLIWPQSRTLTLTSQLVELVEWLLQLLRSPVPIVLAEWQLGPSAERGPEDTSAPRPTSPYFGMVDGVPRSSLLVQLLEAYAQGFAARTARQAAAAASVPQPRTFASSSTSPSGVPKTGVSASSFADGGVGGGRQRDAWGCADPHTSLPSRVLPDSAMASVYGVRGAPWHSAAGPDAHPLRDVVQDVIKGLVRCPEARLFDGQERPILFMRGLESAAETERFANATTVLTSLQYRRAIPSSLR